MICPILPGVRSFRNCGEGERGKAHAGDDDQPLQEYPKFSQMDRHGVLPVDTYRSTIWDE